MARIFLVRHGEPAAGWTEDPDPGLSVRGREQARAAADALVAVGPRPILTSPMRRARETAEALASRWGSALEVVPVLGEVPSPALVAVGERGSWLREIMGARWDSVSEEVRVWRDDLADALHDLQGDTVVFSHFMAINVAVALAEGSESVVSFRPGYCSVTVLEREADGFRVVERGAQAATLVL